MCVQVSTCIVNASVHVHVGQVALFHQHIHKSTGMTLVSGLPLSYHCIH